MVDCQDLQFPASCSPQWGPMPLTTSEEDEDCRSFWNDASVRELNHMLGIYSSPQGQDSPHEVGEGVIGLVVSGT